MADIFKDSEKFQSFSKQQQRLIRRKFNALSPKGKATIAQRFGVGIGGGRLEVEPPQSMGSIAKEVGGELLDVARVPAQQVREGIGIISSALPETGQTGSTALNAAIGAPRAALDVLGETAASFIEPEAVAFGGAGKLLGAAGKAVRTAATTSKGGPFTTTIKDPSLAISKLGDKAFKQLERFKGKLLRKALPEQVASAKRQVLLPAQGQQKFLNKVDDLLQSKVDVDNANLLAAREVAGQMQKRGGTFANQARRLKRKFTRILNSREPGLAKAFERVSDTFKATGTPGREVSLVAALSPKAAAAQVGAFPGVRRAAGAATGLGARAAESLGLPAGAITGAELSRRRGR